MIYANINKHQTLIIRKRLKWFGGLVGHEFGKVDSRRRIAAQGHMHLLWNIDWENGHVSPNYMRPCRFSRRKRIHDGRIQNQRRFNLMGLKVYTSYAVVYPKCKKGKCVSKEKFVCTNMDVL